jgi:uncharacterized protein (TIGR03435 family)
MDRRALALATLLLLSAPCFENLRAQTAGAPRRTFEVASIKPRGDDPSPFPVCGAQSGLRLSPDRLTATNTTLFALITWAYGIGYSCFIVSDQGLVSGGPKWVVSERFDVQATFPAGTPAYTEQQLQDGRAPEIQKMLRALLEDRFKVSLHKVMKEVSVYDLTLAASGAKLTPPRPEEQKFVGISLEPDEKNEILVHLRGNKATLEDMTHVIEPVTHTPVLNRTGLKDEYSFDMKFAVIEPFTGPLANLVGATSPTIFTVFEKELGLKLARGKGSIEQWVIDRAEKPTEN